MSSHIENEGTLLLFLSVEINGIKFFEVNIGLDTCAREDKGIKYRQAVTQGH